MREAQDKLSKGVMPPKDGILLRDYLTGWVEDVRRSIEYNTAMSYDLQHPARSSITSARDG